MMTAIEYPDDPVGSPITQLPPSYHHVLSVSPDRKDVIDLRSVLDNRQWRIVASATCRSALVRLEHRPFAAVICEQKLPDGTWRKILDRVGVFPCRPLLIVTSSTPDDALWSEVLNLGGYDVLAKPFDALEVRHVFDSVRHELNRPVMRLRAGGAA